MFPPMLPRPSRRSGRQVPCRGQAGHPASASRLPGVSVLAPWPLPAAGRLRPYRGPLVQTRKPADRQLYVPGDAGGGARSEPQGLAPRAVLVPLALPAGLLALVPWAPRLAPPWPAASRSGPEGWDPAAGLRAPLLLQCPGVVALQG